MKLRLQSGTRQQVLEDVDCFQGEDDSGSFGIRPGHDRFVTCLAYGLARFRRLGGEWQFLAVPGAVLWTDGAEIVLSCRSYLLDEDPDRISQAIRDQLLAEEAGLRAIKDSFQRLEEEMLRRLWSLDREGDSLGA